MSVGMSHALAKRASISFRWVNRKNISLANNVERDFSLSPFHNSIRDFGRDSISS